jgi:hypothetical protein
MASPMILVEAARSQEWAEQELAESIWAMRDQQAFRHAAGPAGRQADGQHSPGLQRMG